MRERINFRSMGLAIMLLTLIGAAQSADIYLNLTMPAAANWNTAGYWVPDTPNTAGNNYWVGTMPNGATPPGYTGARMNCRSPLVTAPPLTFAGDRLIVCGATGNFLLRNDQTAAVTVADLRCQGTTPQIQSDQNTTGLGAELNGVITNNASGSGSYLNIAATGANLRRGINLTAQLTGPGDVRFQGQGKAAAFDPLLQIHRFTLNNNTNNITGRMFTNADAKIVVNQPNALSSAQVCVLNVGQFTNDVAITAPLARLFITSGSLTTFNASATFGEIWILDTKLATGVYPAATLAATYPLLIVDGSGGAAVITIAGIAQAPNIYQEITMGGGNDWKMAGLGHWNPDTPNLAGSTYYVGTMTDGVTRPPRMGYNTRYNFRTPNLSITPQAFLGTRLNISSSGTLVLRQTTLNSVTIPDLRMIGVQPRIDCNLDGVLELNGVLTSNANANSFANFLVSAAAGPRHINLTARLSGARPIRIEGANVAIGTWDHALVLNNNTNDFSGYIYTYRDAKLIVNQPNGLGNATTVTIANMGQFANKVALNAPNTNLILQNGSVTSISQNMTFRSIRMPGNSQIPKGTWPVAPLATTYPGFIRDNSGSTANVTVLTGLPLIRATLGGNPVTTITFVNHNAVWGPPLTQVLTLTNIGDTPLTFSSWVNSGGVQGMDLDAGTNPMYSIVSAVPSTATPLAAGGTIALTMRMSGTPADYTLGGNNDSTGTLRIRTDATTQTLVLPIRGNTVPVELSTFTVQ